MNPLDVMAALVLEDGSAWGDVAADFQVDDAGAIFDASRVRFHWLGRPRGGSKTTDVGGVALSWLSTEAPPGARGYVCASDKDQAALLVDAASGLVDRTPALASAVTVEALKIVARNGATLEALAADSASAWGLRPSFVVCDELAQWPTTRNARRLWAALVSATGKVGDCRLVCLTSAGEPSHWSKEILDAARTSTAWRVNEVPGPLSWVDPAWLAEQRVMLRDSEFARLHLNIWTAAEDRLVSAEDLAAACTLDGPLEPQPAVSYVVTLDLGLVNDRTVATVAHKHEGRIVVDRLERWRGSKAKPVRLEDVEAWILEAARQYRAKVIVDPWQAAGLCQRLRGRGLSVVEHAFTAQSVGRLASSLHLCLRNRTIDLPDDADLRAELGRVRLRETSPGVVRLDHDSGEHDDQAVAIGLACETLLERGIGQGAAFLKLWRRELDPESAEAETPRGRGAENVEPEIVLSNGQTGRLIYG